MEKEEGSSVLTAKIISGTVLFAVSTVCGLLPFKLVNILKLNQTGKDKKPHLMVDLLLFFGGGVLIATTFLHLLPDITLTINYLKDEGLIPQLGFSLPEFLMMIGFFLIYLVEEIVHNFLHRHQRKNKIANQTNTSSLKDLETHDDYGHGHSHALPIPHSQDEDTLVSSLRGLLIVLALSIHELFEGFAVGLQMSSKGVYFMFAAVCAHKFVIAFCIGIELIVQKTRPMLAVSYIVIYSVVSAIGEFTLQLSITSKKLYFHFPIF